MGIKIVKNRFGAIKPYVKGKTVLDIGCVDARPDGKKKYESTGLHRFLNEHAAQLIGVDTDQDGVKQMQKDGYNVIEANAEDMNLGRRFDCIVAGELIEHLSNQGLFLRTMKRHLVENGVLIITTPNAFSIVSFWRILRKNTVKVHAEHTCWYDPITIEQLLRRHSFEIEEILFTNKSKWYLKKYFYKLKYQIPKLISNIKSYFSSVIIVIARQRTIR
jgi:SAM-dependent methyltransferase